MSTERLAIVVFNLGGPDGPAAVRPFLFNLFNDPYIIGLPMPFRWLLAQTISITRAPKSRRYYAALGGGSPLLAETLAQAAALETAAQNLAGAVKVFTFMRYWHPFARETVAEIKAFRPDRIVVLPLYPQFSTTTTATSVAAFSREVRRQDLNVPVDSICCYPTEDGFVAAVAQKLKDAYAGRDDKPRVVFCAHGLPRKIVEAGDSYQWQVEQTVAAVIARAAIPDLDWVLAYQSRVGPLEWIGPAIEAEMERAARDRRPVIVAPVAFVSEHVETLFELDVTIRNLALSSGAPRYDRMGTVRTDADFIGGLAKLVGAALDRTPSSLCIGVGPRNCPGTYNRCPHRAAG